MRITSARIIHTTTVREGLHLLEVHDPQLAQAVQPGQYCMVRCCHALARDPLLRRPYFVHSVERTQGHCRLLVQVRGRGSAWLAQRQVGEELDIMGPCGHGWTLYPKLSTLLLIGEEAQLSALLLLAQVALEQGLAVTLVNYAPGGREAYPPALLPSEVEYHIVPAGAGPAAEEALLQELVPFVNWADASYFAVSHETAFACYRRFERLRRKHAAQGVAVRPLVCASGVCLACTIETHAGAKLVCRDGPAFDLRELVR